MWKVRKKGKEKKEVGKCCNRNRKGWKLTAKFWKEERSRGKIVGRKE